jgi:O-acetyl-ADP-ribose deacetylase (regulator of RNase III)
MLGLTSIAFPCISCGFRRFPIGEAAQVASRTVKEFMSKTPNPSVRTVIFTTFTEEQEHAYAQILTAADGFFIIVGGHTRA